MDDFVCFPCTLGQRELLVVMLVLPFGQIVMVGKKICLWARVDWFDYFFIHFEYMV